MSVSLIILAAGQSKRMDPLPDKNFIEFCGKPLIQWQIEQIHAAGFSEVAVIGGRHNLDDLAKIDVAMMSHRRTKRSDTKNTFAILEQKDLDEGMAGAVLSAEKWLNNEPFLVVSSNDMVESSIYALLKKNLTRSCSGLLVAKKVTEYFPGGYLKTAGSVDGNGESSGAGRSSRGDDMNDQIVGIVEKPGAGNEPSDLVNLVFHYHAEPKKLFTALKATKSSRDDRYEAALDSLIKSGSAFFALPYEF